MMRIAAVATTYTSLAAGPCAAAMEDVQEIALKAALMTNETELAAEVFRVEEDVRRLKALEEEMERLEEATKQFDRV